MAQMPFYKTGERDMGAPQGFQPQTQANNGGPRGLGQPARSTPQSIPTASPRSAPQGPQAQGPMPGTGHPGALYGPSQAAQDPRSALWANRNSMDPLQLIMQAFLSMQGRAPQQFEIDTLLQAPSVDALAEQLLNLQQPGQQTPVQSAILGIR